MRNSDKRSDGEIDELSSNRKYFSQTGASLILNRELHAVLILSKKPTGNETKGSSITATSRR
jgi:hypothetical protein